MLIPVDDQVAGIHRVASEVIRILDKIQHPELEFIIFRQKREKQILSKQIVFPKLRIPGMSFFRLFLIVPFISRLYKTNAVVEFAHFGPFNLPKRTRRITYIHDLTPILFHKFHVFNGWFLHELFLNRILKNADLIFADSQNTAKDLVKHYPVSRDKITVNYLGVSDQFSKKEDQKLLSRYEVNRPYFIYVGTIEPRKGIHTLLEAFEIFKKEDREDHDLLIIGSMGWKMDSFEKLIDNHPFKENIKYLGFVQLEELVAFYTMAKFLILPSRYEGFGLPIIEAMYCGTRSIVAKNSSLKEIGTLCDSLFFKTDDSFELAEKMKSEDTKIEQTHRFTWKDHVDKFISRLIDIL